MSEEPEEEEESEEEEEEDDDGDDGREVLEVVVKGFSSGPLVWSLLAAAAAAAFVGASLLSRAPSRRLLLREALPY